MISIGLLSSITPEKTPWKFEAPKLYKVPVKISVKKETKEGGKEEDLRKKCGKHSHIFYLGRKRKH